MSKVSVLVLDFLKPNETRLCLESIKKHCLFDKEVVYLNNGGDIQDYAWDFYKEGLVDRLIVNSENLGCGWGMEILHQNSNTEYSIMMQNDQFFHQDLSQENIFGLIQAFESHPDVGGISLAGYPAGENTYSDRCHLISSKFYLSIDKEMGGCGPLNHIKYSEQSVQEFFKKNNYKFLRTTRPFVTDNGVFSIREMQDGALYRHRCDLKTLWVEKFPIKKTEIYPPLNDQEWEDMLNKNWPVWGKDKEGRIPEAWREHSFRVWPD